jgi:hypothetical protein
MCATAEPGIFQCCPARPAKFPEGKSTGFFSRISREKYGEDGEKFGFVILNGRKMYFLILFDFIGFSGA